MLSGFDTWDRKCSKFHDPHIFFQWNATLLLFVLGEYPILQSIHLVNKAIAETMFDVNNPGKFISYMTGYAENAVGLTIVIMEVWCQTKAEFTTAIQNELFPYNKPMSIIHWQNGQLPTYVKTCDRIMVLIIMTCLILTFSFVTVLTLDAD